MKKSLVLIPLFLFVVSVFRCQELTPPLAQKIPNTLLIHGDTLTDNYFWMRDKNAPEVINHLYAENTYADNVMKGSTFLQKVLYEEFKSRRKETQTSRPQKRKGYYYYNRTEKGKDYPFVCRKKDSLTAPEQVVLDINKLAEEQQYINVSGFNISPDQNLLYYGIDSKGNHILTYYLKNLSGDSLCKGDLLKNVLSLVWAEDNKTVYYTVAEDKTLRAWRLYRHVIGTAQNEDELLLEELDKTMQLDVSKSASKKYIFTRISKTKSSETWYMLADGSDRPHLFLKRDPNTLYVLEHTEGDEFFIHTNLKAINNRLVKTKISKPDPAAWETVIPHNESALLSSFVFTKDFLIVTERENAQNRVRIINRKTKESHTLATGLELYEIGIGFEDYNYENSDEIEYGFSNMVTPQETWKYNLYTGEKNKIEQDTLQCAYIPSQYDIKRIYAKARDGAMIPITLAYKKGIALNGENPMLLTSYGSYGAPHSIGFSDVNISLLDRGFIVATAHIRGSNDLGNSWYENGKLFNKKNTFFDFIDCAEFLISEKYTCVKKLAVEGASAGGLLMGAVSNMRPDLFQCVVAGVPFVDVINTMLDETIPLTTFEFEEWGNPKQKDYYQYMRSYSPYDNVERKNYPNMLVFAGYNDAQVAYWEPAKWVAKMREMKTDSNLLLFKTNMEAGHGGGSGRTTRWKELAFNTAFMMRCLGVEENYLTVRGKVVDDNNTTIPFVYVYVDGTTNGTTTNGDGEFSITVKQEKDIALTFQTLGYVSQKKKLELGTDVSELVIKMKSENIVLKEVLVKANSKDPAYGIMKEAIKRRKVNDEKVQSFSADIYMKNNVKLIKLPKKIPFFLKNQLPDTNNLGLVSLSESVARYHYARPDKRKEEMIASKVAGEKAGFSWNRVEDVFVNFYESSVDMGYYSERPFISPLAGGALLSYKFKYLGTFYVDNKPVHKIKVIPRRKGDPLFQGEIYIAEGDNYQIYSNDLFITKDAQIDFVDTLHIKQEMVFVNDSVWAPLQLQIYSRIKFFGIDASDVSTAVISNYKLNTVFTKKFFGNEVFRIEKEAAKKDSSYWTTTRPAILSETESKFYIKGDSILRKKETKEYKDSVNKAVSRFKFGLGGITKYNPLTGSSFSTNELFNMVSYNTVEGTRFRLAANYGTYNKETRQSTFISGYARYGMDNKRWGGGVLLYRAHGKKSRSFVFKAGRNVHQFNSHNPIGEFMNAGYTLLNKNNFMKLYQKDAIEIGYHQEIVNGLYGSVNTQYMQREALLNKSFYYWIENGSRHFRPNNPLAINSYKDTLAFTTHQAVQVQVAFKWIPFSKYATYGDVKQLLETKWPEFSFAYRKGIGVNTAKFNYDYVEMGIGKDLDMKAVGLFKFDVLGGIFFNTAGMNFVDYKHFSGNQTIFLMNRSSVEGPRISTRDASTEFHALDYYSSSTNDKFVEVHVSHNFRGFFIGKIPLLRKTKFYEIAGINALFTPQYSYSELYVGVDKIFKFFRFDVGTSFRDNKELNLFYRGGVRFSF